MIKFKNFIVINLFLIIILVSTKSFSENHNVLEVLELIQKDLKTLEKAVYSGSLNDNLNDSISSNSTMDQNTEDVLTRHLLKLSEIENQFQELTNKFEEINFKLDKLSNRLSKVQADNQMRFQELENSSTITTDENKKITSLPKEETKKVLPGSSEPQDLGSISYKDTETNLLTQQTQSIETTGTIVTETFESEEKLLPNIYSISNIYPNPFNPMTTIKFRLTDYVPVQIEVYDLSGRRVEILINDYQQPGYHTVVWNASSYPSGLYFIQIKTDKYGETRKVLLIK